MLEQIRVGSIKKYKNEKNEKNFYLKKIRLKKKLK